MKIIENFIENKFISLLLLFLFLLIIQEPSFRLFSSETHYIGEALQKIINYFPHENSAYIHHIFNRGPHSLPILIDVAQ